MGASVMKTDLSISVEWLRLLQGNLLSSHFFWDKEPCMRKLWGTYKETETPSALEGRKEGPAFALLLLAPEDKDWTSGRQLDP